MAEAFSRCLRYGLVAALGACGLVLSAHAQQLVQLDQTLGMTLNALRANVPGVERLARPVAAPRGLRGQWHLSGTSLAGHPFDSVFYLQGQTVARVEQVRSVAAPCNENETFRSVVQSMGLGYGSVPQGLDAFGVVADGTVDVAAHLQVNGEACVIRVVYQPRVLKDASTL